MRRSLGFLAAICVCGATTIAHAQPGNTPPAGPPPPATYVPPPVYPTGPAPATTTVRYGTTIAGVDALAAGLVLVGALVVIGGAFDDGDEDQVGAGVVLMIAGTAVYAFGPAYVHSTKNNNSSAWKSVALRLGLPMLGGMIGSAMATETCDSSGYCYQDDDNAGSLAGLGMVAAMVIDWSVLAKVNVPVQQPAYYPYASATSGGGGVAGLAGSF